MLIRSDDEGKDSMCWGLTSNGKFSISSAYDALMPPSLDDPDSTWNLIWKLYIPPKIHHFLWLVYHEKILNNMDRAGPYFIGALGYFFLGPIIYIYIYIL